MTDSVCASARPQRSVDDGPLGHAAIWCYRIERRRRAGSSHNRRRSPPPLPRGTRRLGRGAMGGVVFGGSKLASFYGSRMWHAIILHRGITNRAGGRSGRGRVIHCMLGNRWDDKITEMKFTYLRSAVQSLDGADLVLCMQGLWTRRGFPAAAGVVGMQRSARLW